MKKLIKKIYFAFIINILISFPAFSGEHNSVNSFENYSKLRQILDDFIYLNPDLKNAFIGVKVRDLLKKQDVYTLNAQKLFVPASNTKIFTTLLAIEKLGPDFVFKTTVSTDGIIENKIVKGNIYFNFVGDPTFTHNNLKDLIQQLKNSGITEISGDIIINNSLFDNIYYGPGWMWDDMDSCDSSPISPVYIDDNILK